MPEDEVLTTEQEPETDPEIEPGTGTDPEPEPEPEPVDELLAAVKMALRVTTTAFDSEIESLIDAAQLDLGVAGVVLPETIDALVRTAVITYCRVRFGQPDDYDRLKRAYDEQKAQLSMCTGYTNWGDGVGQV